MVDISDVRLRILLESGESGIEITSVLRSIKSKRKEIIEIIADYFDPFGDTFYQICLKQRKVGRPPSIRRRHDIGEWVAESVLNGEKVEVATILAGEKFHVSPSTAKKCYRGYVEALEEAERAQET